MNEALWRQVEAALDERRDPFAQTALASALAADPGTERAARRLVGRLALVSGVPAPHARRRSRRGVLVLAPVAAVLVATLVLLAVTRRASLSPGTPAGECSARVTLQVEQTTPPPAHGAVVPLASRRVVRWTLQGTAP